MGAHPAAVQVAQQEGRYLVAEDALPGEAGTLYVVEGYRHVRVVENHLLRILRSIDTLFVSIEDKFFFSHRSFLK